MKKKQNKRLNEKRILVVVAHPDDEVFGPGGTIAKYAKEKVRVHIICATKGEAGEDNDKKPAGKKYRKLSQVRALELLASAKTLGVEKVEFLGYKDGVLCNNIYHELAGKISQKIRSFRPQIVLTIERRGVSGHLDHIAVSLTATFAFLKTKIASKLYYFCISDKMRSSRLDDYFIYFPEGYNEEEITTRIDISKVWDIKKEAMLKHKSQIKDAQNLLEWFDKFARVEHFILGQYNGISKPDLPEKDFFSGL